MTRDQRTLLQAIAAGDGRVYRTETGGSYHATGKTGSLTNSYGRHGAQHRVIRPSPARVDRDIKALVLVGYVHNRNTPGPYQLTANGRTEAQRTSHTNGRPR